MPDTAQESDIILDGTFTESSDISYKHIGYELNFMNVDPSIFEDCEGT